MKAVILAAGQGTRIRSVHGERPKCLLEIDSEWTILDQQVAGLLSCDIEEIGIVVGYEKDQIIQHLANRHFASFGRFRFIENPAFAETNNIYSLWLARHWLNGESFVCLNADVVFDPEVLRPAINSWAPINMIVDPAWRDETMKVVISQGRVIQMSKKISRSEFSGTYIGITTFDASVVEPLFERITTLISTGRTKEFFNVAVQQLADEGVEVGFTSTSDLPWAEIDDPGDLAFARLNIFPELAMTATAAA